ncbi:MAG: agmatinase [Promethearchaeota archaeon]
MSSIKEFFFGSLTTDLSVANLFVLGIPWDASSSYRKGASKAPSYIRQSTTNKLFNPYTELKTNLMDKWRIFDGGDVEFSEFNPINARNEVLKVLRNFLDDREIHQFLFLGGDHLTTYFSVYSLAKLNIFHPENVGIVYLDSHPDLYDDYEGNKHSHACVLRRIIDETEIDPTNVVQVGIRAPTPEQLEYAAEFGILIISTPEFQRYGAAKTLSKIKNHFKEKIDYTYLSIDLDVIDPAYAPGLGNPQPGGISTREIIDFIHELSDLPLFAVDIVEFCPNHDYSGVTAFLAAKLIQETLGIMKFR